MEILDKEGKRVRVQDKIREVKQDRTMVAVLKPVKREDRKKLPPKVKVVFFAFLLRGECSPHIIADCQKDHPEYFEYINEELQDEKEK